MFQNRGLLKAEWLRSVHTSMLTGTGVIYTLVFTGACSHYPWTRAVNTDLVHG